MCFEDDTAYAACTPCGRHNLPVNMPPAASCCLLPKHPALQDAGAQQTKTPAHSIALLPYPCYPPSVTRYCCRSNRAISSCFIAPTSL